MRTQVVGHLLGELVRRVLDDLVKGDAVRAVEHPGDVDDQAAAGVDHHRRGEVRGERGRAQAAGEHQVPVAPLHLPERRLVVEP